MLSFLVFYVWSQLPILPLQYIVEYLSILYYIFMYTISSIACFHH